MRISRKTLYALQALTTLARNYGRGPVRMHDIASADDIPEKFLELVMLQLKNARFVQSTRGAKGGHLLRRAPAEIRLSDVIRLIEGPLAPYGDAPQLRNLVHEDSSHRALYQVFLDLRDATANILDNTTLADLISNPVPSGSHSAKGAPSHKSAQKPKAGARAWRTHRTAGRA